MKTLAACLGLLFTCSIAGAADITTVKGRVYRGVHDVLIRGDVVSFSTDSEIVKLKTADLPPTTVDFYQKKQAAQNAAYAPVAPASPAAETPSAARHPAVRPDQLKQFHDDILSGLQTAREDKVTSLTPDAAYSMANLEKAKAQAAKEGKLLGFIMEWDVMFKKSVHPMDQGGNSGFVHFYTVFHKPLVLVFVRHEDELEKVPDAVKQGFFGPDEGGFAPNMAVTNGDATDFVCEIPLGGAKSNGSVREALFIEGAKKMDRYLQGGR